MPNGLLPPYTSEEPEMRTHYIFLLKISRESKPKDRGVGRGMEKRNTNLDLVKNMFQLCGDISSELLNQ